MPGGEGETVAVAGSEQPVLAALPAAPNRADGVDHVACRQAEARGDLRLSRLATAKFDTSRSELRTCGTVDGAADATARGQHGVGGIDDGIDVEPGDVAFDNLNAVRHGPIGDAEWGRDQAPRLKRC
jgi:hypothetical protein